MLIEALSLYPDSFLNVSAALANLDPAMEQAAANLGASRWTIFRRITLPLMRPGLFAGGTIVLIWSFTELGTPLMFDYYHVTPVQIFNRLNQVQANPLPYALVVVMLVTSVLLYVVGKLVLGRRQDAAVTKASVQSSERNTLIRQSIPVLALPSALAGSPCCRMSASSSTASAGSARGINRRSRKSSRPSIICMACPTNGDAIGIE